MADRPLRTLLGRLRQAAGPGNGLTDGQLLERFVSRRDGAAFEALLQRHGPMVWAVGRRLLRHQQDAEDAFQATFLALVRKAGSIGKRESLGSWLYRVAYRVALRARSRAVKRALCERPIVDLPAAEVIPDWIWQDLRPVLDEEVNRLPERYRAAFVLCYLQGRTNAEAARELGCPEGTVLSRLFGARQRLRDRLERRGVVLSGGALAGALSHQAASAAPAALASSTLGFALAVAAGQAPAGSVGVSVTSLTEGVLRAMWLTKVKVGASLVLAAAVLAGGTGLLAYRGLRAGQPVARAEEQAPSPPVPQGLPPPDAAQPRREADQDLLQEQKERLQVEKERLEAEKREREVELERAKVQLQHLDDLLQRQEEKWFDELVEARKQLIIAEELLRGLERRHTAQRESGQERGQQRAAEKRVQSLQDTMDQLARKLQDTPAEKERQKISALLEQARVEMQVVEQRIEKMEHQRTEELVEARQKVTVAEEHLRRLERRQGAQRERTQAQLQAIDERIRLLQGSLPRAEAGPGRLQELERKVDQLLREIAELRREMRRKPPEEK